MKKLFLCCTAFLSLWVQPFFAQKAVVDKIIEIGHQDNQAAHQLDILTNRFGGRPIGSDAYENAAEWMVAWKKLANFLLALIGGRGLGNY